MCAFLLLLRGGFLGWEIGEGPWNVEISLTQYKTSVVGEGAYQSISHPEVACDGGIV